MIPFEEFQRLYAHHMSPMELEAAYKKQTITRIDQYFDLLIGTLHHKVNDLTPEQLSDLEITVRTTLNVTNRRIGTANINPGGESPGTPVQG
jgi:hypothetical protein